MKIPEQLRHLARLARAQGWVVSHTAGSHLAWRSPEGPVVITSSSPGDRTKHSRGRIRSQLRRAGLRDV